MTETDACLRQTSKKVCTIYSKFLKTTTKCFHQSGQKELAMALNSTQSPEKNKTFYYSKMRLFFMILKMKNRKKEAFTGFVL